MELDSVIIIFAMFAAVIGFILIWGPSRSHSRSVGTQPKTSAGPKPSSRLVVTRPQRRRRNSGGYYPIGYDGPYEDGEDFVDYLIWFALLDAMSDENIANLGEYGEYEEIEETIVEVVDMDDPADDNFYVTEPEATSFEPLEKETIKPSGGWGDDYDSGDSWGGSDDSDSGGSDDD